MESAAVVEDEPVCKRGVGGRRPAAFARELDVGGVERVSGALPLTLQQPPGRVLPDRETGVVDRLFGKGVKQVELGSLQAVGPS